MRLVRNLLLVLLLGALAFVCARREEAARPARPQEVALLYLPSGHHLRAASFGYDGLLADFIYLWSIQYYGLYEGTFRLQYVRHVYNVITDLDPHFIDAYSLGALILNVETRSPADALRLLDKGIAANPSDWVLPFEAGFLAYKDLGDYALAARYYGLADKPGAPLAIPRLRAAMVAEVDPGSALEIWQSLLETSTDPATRKKAAQRIRDLRIGEDLAALRQVIAEFRRRHGFLPSAWSVLVRARLLREVPVDPDGNVYLLDSSTGEVRSLRGVQFTPRPRAGTPSPPAGEGRPPAGTPFP